MKIFSATQIRAWDQFSIVEEGIPSIDLMERAAKSFCQVFYELRPNTQQKVHIFCGPGNNGGDGLAIGRLLHQKAYPVEIIICEISPNKSIDFQINLERLPAFDTIDFKHLKQGDDLSFLDHFDSQDIIIDGLFGSGLSRVISGYWADLLSKLNQSKAYKIAIDIPSGVFSDQLNQGPAFQAHHTISFQSPKLAFFMPELGTYVGEWYLAPIGLSRNYQSQEKSIYHYITVQTIKSIYKPRKKFGHKGTYGHTLIIAGSYGMLGAASLTAKASLRTGAGLVSLHIPKIGYQSIQINVPEAIVSIDPDEYYFSESPPLTKYRSIAIGPGLGQSTQTEQALQQLIVSQPEQTLVFDADALNLISKNPHWLKKMPSNSILCPHPGEFQRLFGISRNSFEQLEVLKEKAIQHQVYIILKGAYTRIACPDGNVYFNSTGNPGMGTAGSGDVLTGILAGLLAQNYSPKEASLLGVYLHALAGDLAAAEKSEEALIASDIIEFLGLAYKKLISD